MMKKYIALAATALLLLATPAVGQQVGPGPAPGSVSSVYMFATLAASQSVSQNTPAIVIFDTIVKDTGSYYSAVTGKFTPLVSGEYSVCTSSSIIGTIAASAVNTISVQKNGTDVARNGDTTFAAITADRVAAPAACGVLVAVNGSTDYIDISVTLGATTPSVQGNADPFTYVSIQRIGP